jgi:isopentenyl diphosphate isomerase/L-lactate dehydrogenase-like FMN-dependent dehydrogenase
VAFDDIDGGADGEVTLRENCRAFEEVALRADVVRTLKLLGCPSVAELDSSYVDVPPHWRRGTSDRTGSPS